MYFTFWEPVYYHVQDPSFPSESPEATGHFVGIAEHVGHAMTFMVLTDDTNRVIFHSNIRTACDPSQPNFRVDHLGGERSPPLVLKSA
jgi:hypothetical protein